jgi:hypothetical protein
MLRTGGGDEAESGWILGARQRASGGYLYDSYSDHGRTDAGNRIGKNEDRQLYRGWSDPDIYVRRGYSRFLGQKRIHAWQKGNASSVAGSDHDENNLPPAGDFAFFMRFCIYRFHRWAVSAGRKKG